MSATTTSLWGGGVLAPREDCDVRPAAILAADSWLVVDGAVRGIDLHRNRFRQAVASAGVVASDGDGPDNNLDVDAFWDAALAALPRTGAWFPRVEFRRQLDAPQLLLRIRPAPELRRAIRLATWSGPDPRTAPTIKGPDLEALTRLRTAVQADDADEAVLLAPDGRIAEGATTCLVWWRGDALCLPAPDLPRIDSVTVRSMLALATALGLDVLHEEPATPDDLDGLEVWALNALHGPRIVTAWIDGPATAEQPGRLGTWRARLDALRRPLPPAPVPDTAAGARTAPGAHG